METLGSPIGLSLLGVLTLLLGPLSFRLGVLSPKTSFLFLLLGMLLEIGAAGWALVSAVRSPPGPLQGWIAVALGVAALLIPVSGALKAKSLPMIHDITTDTANPPEFVTVAPERSLAPNGVAYGGPEIAALQKGAYADLQPIESKLKPTQAFETAVTLVQQLGWKLVSKEQTESGTAIEATDTTLLYGFKDDIVIRIQSAREGSRLDLRSASRIGLSDLGKNAERIRKFREAYQAAGG